MEPEKPRVERLAFSVAEAAESIGCSAGFIRKLIERGELKSAKIGRRRVVIAAELQNLLAQKVEQRI
jgi:excisionase family DNA binding protein